MIVKAAVSADTGIGQIVVNGNTPVGVALESGRAGDTIAIQLEGWTATMTVRPTFALLDLDHPDFIRTVYREIQQRYDIPDCDEFTLVAFEDYMDATLKFVLTFPVNIRRTVVVTKLARNNGSRAQVANNVYLAVMAAAEDCWKELTS